MSCVRCLGTGGGGSESSEQLESAAPWPAQNTLARSERRQESRLARCINPPSGHGGGLLVPGAGPVSPLLILSGGRGFCRGSSSPSPSPRMSLATLYPCRKLFELLLSYIIFWDSFTAGPKVGVNVIYFIFMTSWSVPRSKSKLDVLFSVFHCAKFHNI